MWDGTRPCRWVEWCELCVRGHQGSACRSGCTICKSPISWQCVGPSIRVDLPGQCCDRWRDLQRCGRSAAGQEWFLGGSARQSWWSAQTSPSDTSLLCAVPACTDPSTTMDWLSRTRTDACDLIGASGTLCAWCWSRGGCICWWSVGALCWIRVLVSYS